jgi:hypothetical protein
MIDFCLVDTYENEFSDSGGRDGFNVMLMEHVHPSSNHAT